MKETFQLTESAALIYEEQKVPAIFAPLADATVAKLDVHPDDVVLDLACGTGVVARRLRRLLGPTCRIMGVDLSEGMIAAARDVSNREGLSCDWFACDAASLPFDDGQFSVVICQQGLQFFPNEEAVIREVNRVLKPGGCFVITIWSEPSPLFLSLAIALEEHVGSDTAKRSLAPFNYKGLETLSQKLKAGGFSSVKTDQIIVDRRINDPTKAIPREIASNPIAPAVTAMGPAILDQIVSKTVEALQEFKRGDCLVVPQRSHCFIAKSPSG